VQNRNPTISLDLNRIFDLKGESTDIIADWLQPVVIVQRHANIVRQGVNTNFSSATVMTTASDKDTYLTGASLSFVKDITATTTAVSLRVYIEGVQRRIIELSTLTLTVERGQTSISFPIPIKIDRNTNITIDSLTNVANFSINAQIIGYTVETTK
jgi:hypothetical protein